MYANAYKLVSKACDAMNLSLVEGDVFLRFVKEAASTQPDYSAHEVIIDSMIRWYNDGKLDMEHAAVATEKFDRYMATKEAAEADDKKINPDDIIDFVVAKA